jgi:uncharacterized protein
VDRVFLDANVLFSAAYGPHRRVGCLWELRSVELITSAYAAAEAFRNVARKYPDRLPALSKLLSAVGLVTDVASSTLPVGIALPAKDAPILLAAIAAKATHLITGDHHFEAYFGRQIGGVTVLTPAEYLKRLSQS